MQSFAKIFFIVLIVISLAAIYFCNFVSEAKAMAQVSDRISLSWPDTGVSHTINFLTTAAIPPAGKIIITPESGKFTIPAGFDYTDIDLATSSVSGGSFSDRVLASTSSAAADGVSTVASSTSGSITITLNSSYGIDNGVYVKIELGTNATYGGAGDKQIVNNNSIGSYGIVITAYSASDQMIKRAKVMIAIVEPVTMSVEFSKIRSNAAPIGWLVYGTTETIMSLVTNYPAVCRYTTASGTLYADISNDFSYASSTQYYAYHTATISSLVNGEQYDYYVRCKDENGVSDEVTLCVYNEGSSPYGSTTMVSSIDYWFHFGISAQEGDEGEESGDPGGSGGGAGGGGGGGGGATTGTGVGELLPFPPLPGTPSLLFQGWAYPSSYISVIKDGIEETREVAAVNASFNINIYDLTQGVYTFGLWAEDKDKRKSITESFTFYVKDGTKTEIYEIIIPPTIQLNKASVEPGEIIEVFGYSAPFSAIEAWMYPNKSNLTDLEIIKKQSVANDSGRWSIFFNTVDVVSGQYKIKAKTRIETVGESDFSYALDCGVGVEAGEGICQGADLNGDGKVNLTDFSILLYYWGTDDECADQNKDGTVNLTDFSIMMYYWTG